MIPVFDDTHSLAQETKANYLSRDIKACTVNFRLPSELGGGDRGLSIDSTDNTNEF